MILMNRHMIPALLNGKTGVVAPGNGMKCIIRGIRITYDFKFAGLVGPGAEGFRQRRERMRRCGIQTKRRLKSKYQCLLTHERSCSGGRKYPPKRHPTPIERSIDPPYHTVRTYQSTDAQTLRHGILCRCSSKQCLAHAKPCHNSSTMIMAII